MVGGSGTACGKLCENPSEEISGHPAGLRSQVSHLIHPLVKNVNDRNPVAGLPKVDGMLFDIASPIALPDRRAVLRLKRSLRQSGAGGFEGFGIADRLGQTPLCYGVIEYALKVGLGSWAEPKFNHIALICAA